MPNKSNAVIIALLVLILGMMLWDRWSEHRWRSSFEVESAKSFCKIEASANDSILRRGAPDRSACDRYLILLLEGR